MASPPPINSCLVCQSASPRPLLNGWKSRAGGYAQLCFSCHSLYEAGQFCVAFHANEDGWRDCISCKKPVHCGCIVSLSNYSLHDFGGIICAECKKTNTLLAMHSATAISNPQDLEMQSSMVPQADHIPLFEKLMSPSDASLKQSRIIIPIKYAKAYFPKVSEGQVIPLDVLDTDGNDWHLSYRCWVNKCRIEYVMQGVNYFKRSKNLQAGDTVAFYRRESDGKLILELKKTSAGTTSHDQAST